MVKPRIEACAVCRHRRKKCTDHCLFRPYFPYSTHQRQFQTVHKLFDVGYIKKIINNLDDHRHKDTAMQSFIYESNARAQYPVEGCYGIIRQLHLQIRTASAELQNVSNQLALYRTLHLQQNDKNQNNNNNSASFDRDQNVFDNLDLDNLDL